jgi:hypothetical protein
LYLVTNKSHIAEIFHFVDYLTTMPICQSI